MSEFLSFPISDDVAVIAFIALLALSFAFWGTGLINNYRSNPKRPINQSRAQEILRNGGPRNLKEQLLLFPEACPKCGSREIVQVKWNSEYFFSYEWLINHYQLMNIAKVCARCEHHLEGDFLSNIINAYCIKENIKVNSPYFPDDQSDSLLDFQDNLNAFSGSDSSD